MEDQVVLQTDSFKEMFKEMILKTSVRTTTIELGPGVHEITLPANVTQIIVDIGGGGASGEGLVDLIPDGANGGDSFIEQSGERIISVTGGEREAIPVRILDAFYAGERYRGGSGEDSKEGNGSTEHNSEYNGMEVGLSGGGHGVTHGRYSTRGGGAGEVIHSKLIEINQDTLLVSVGGGGIFHHELEDEEDERVILSPGNGGDGFARIRYSYLSIREDEPVVPPDEPDEGEVL